MHVGAEDPRRCLWIKKFPKPVRGWCSGSYPVSSSGADCKFAVFGLGRCNSYTALKVMQQGKAKKRLSKKKKRYWKKTKKVHKKQDKRWKNKRPTWRD